jgi:DNA-binding transcriptional LysR family regulator
MASPDLNLLLTLDVLLAEGNVTRAAQRLHLSPSAMSRTLARLRDTMGDPLLVRAGRVLVPTPRAMELRDQVRQLVQETAAVLRPVTAPRIDQLARSFTLRCSEGFVENFGPALITRISREAPGVRLCFVQKTDRESTRLREGTVDLETGVVSSRLGPELRTQALFRDRIVGVVQLAHPLAEGAITAARYAGGRHVLVSRRGQETGPIDDALGTLGLQRHIATTVGGFATALTLAHHSDLIASVPERHSGMLRKRMFSFALPVALPELSLSLLWHPRHQADPVHQWLRDCVKDVCAAASEDIGTVGCHAPTGTAPV